MAVDFKQVIRSNNQKSILIITLAIVLYGLAGLFIDFLIYYFTRSGYVIGYAPSSHQMINHHNSQGFIQGFFDNFYHFLVSLFHLNTYPIATGILIVLAIGSLLFNMLNQKVLMLSGQKYFLINPKNELVDDANHEIKQLYNVVEEVKIASGVNYMPKIYIMNTPMMNAFASGMSEKSSLICVSSGLVNNLNRDELRAVVAHEMTHIKNNDIKISLFFAALVSAVIVASEGLYNLVFFGTLLGSDDDREGGNGSIVILVFLLLTVLILRIVLPMFLMLLKLFVSRKREFMADAGAVEITRDNIALGNALLKISDHYDSGEFNDKNNSARKNAYIYKPEKMQFLNLGSHWFSTHPTIKQRLEAINYPMNSNN